MDDVNKWAVEDDTGTATAQGMTRAQAERRAAELTERVGRPFHAVDHAELITIETMPDCHRASHRKAHNWGVYPHNGAEREEVSRADAELVVAEDPDGYAHIVEGEV